MTRDPGESRPLHPHPAPVAMSQVERQDDLTIGSACSGYGGLDLGLIAAVGGRVVWHLEYDKHPSAVLDARFPGVPNYGDITTVDWSQVEPVDWFTAGYPCQPFSHAGKRKGSADERHLWPFVAAAIGALRPRRVLLENVAGHVSLGLDAVLWDLAALGYDARWGVVRAADAGAPHGRARLFILAADARGQRHGSGQDDRSLGRVDGQDAGQARQRERSRAIAGDRSAAAAADAGGGPFAGPAAARDGLSVAAQCGDESAPDTERGGRDGRASEPQRRSVGRVAAAGCGEGPDTDANADRGRCSVGPEQHGDTASAPADRDSCGEHPDGPAGAVAWGEYEPAVRRWEAVTGRQAPRPTEPGIRGGERLSPRFVEWMQGLPDGWVTDVLSRNPALKALGNGVVPQQAALAVRTLLSLEGEVAA